MIIEAAFIGLTIATLFVELTGIYPGGIIVPAYIALFVDQPLRIVGTLLVALLAWGTYQLLARVFILFGRRRFLMLVLLGGVWTLIGYRFAPMLWPASLELRAIGWVIPGLLANTFERQGLFTTIPALGIVSAITYFVLRLLMHS
ncbi:poly-gamma-glutamate biosynthesis protein PgsC [Candidatus Bipolaricaulota bacterium]|nr:poly-gamma-glutamate biosynthesis protein PgsC [Candidatus Bipolaricaulota bacterium]